MAVQKINIRTKKKARRKKIIEKFKSSEKVIIFLNLFFSSPHKQNHHQK